MIAELFQKGRNKKPLNILLDIFWMSDYPTLTVTQGERFLASVFSAFHLMQKHILPDKTKRLVCFYPQSTTCENSPGEILSPKRSTASFISISIWTDLIFVNILVL